MTLLQRLNGQIHGIPYFFQRRCSFCLTSPALIGFARSVDLVIGIAQRQLRTLLQVGLRLDRPQIGGKQQQQQNRLTVYSTPFRGFAPAAAL